MGLWAGASSTTACCDVEAAMLAGATEATGANGAIGAATTGLGACATGATLAVAGVVAPIAATGLDCTGDFVATSAEALAATGGTTTGADCDGSTAALGTATGTADGTTGSEPTEVAPCSLKWLTALLTFSYKETGNYPILTY